MAQGGGGGLSKSLIQSYINNANVDIQGDAQTLQGNSPSDLKTDLSQVYGNINDIAGIAERHDLELSLRAWKFDDGFIDILWDKSKILNAEDSISIQTGSNGSIKLGTILRDDFEDGAGNWQSNSTTGNAYSGSTALVCNPAGSYTQYYWTGSNIDNPPVISWWAYRDSGLHYWQIKDDSGNNAARVQYGDIPQDGSWHKVTVEFDYSDNSYEIKVDGSVIRSGSFNGTVKDFANYGKNGGIYMDDFKFGQATSGTVTHIRKDLGFTPSKLVVSPDYTLNNQSIELVVSDNSGNSIKITESEFDSEVSVNFSDGNIQVTDNLSGDGSNSPEINKVKIIGVQ